MLCRKRAASGYVYETADVDQERNGIGFPFLMEMIRAKVAGSDLEDLQRVASAALYIGLQLGHKKTAQGLPLDAPLIETDIVTGL